MKKHFAVLLLAGILPVVSCPAQLSLFRLTDKTVAVPIPHAPSIGLTVKRIAFGPPAGPCADELVNSQIMPDFQRNNIEVVDRQHLAQILAEQHFSQSQQGELALGRVLGPSVMIFVRVDDCTPTQNQLVDNSQKAMNGQPMTTYIAKTRLSIHGSLEVADLTTGQVLGSHPFTAAPEKANTSNQGYPEYPPADELRETALRDASVQIHNDFFPWMEQVKLFVHDDKDCGLKQVADLIHGGDSAGALQLAQTNLGPCKTQKNEKVLARAYYDTAVASILAGQYEQAKPLLSQAMQLKGADEATAALQACNRAEDGAAAVKQYEAKVAAIPAPSPISFGAPVEAAPAPAAPQQPAAAGASAAGSATVEARLKKLDQLLKQGLITKKQYDDKKAEILKDL